MKSKSNINFIILIMGIALLFMNSCRKEENKPPGSQIVSPTDGAEFVQEDIVTISVEADDKDGSITVVRFYIDDVYVGTSKTKPYTYKWDTTDKTIGNHIIKIIAVDNEGSSTSCEISIVLKARNIAIIFNPDLSYGSVTDIESNIYKTIVVENRTWMAENLKTTKYNDGTPITWESSFSAWINRTTPAYCWYDNNELKYKDIYGALYNWFTVDTKKLCPTGWHVPDDLEWYNVAYFYVDLLGGRLKEIGTRHWAPPDSYGDPIELSTNESGFTALPGGWRNYDGFVSIKLAGMWWSSTSHSESSAGYVYLDHNYSYSGSNFTDLQMGLSVRCIKDN